MMNSTIRRTTFALMLFAATLGMSGCNWIKGLGKKDNVAPPAELVDFSPTLNVQRLWSTGIGDGSGKSGARMVPAVAAGRVYAAGVDGRISALDATSGSKVWSEKSGERTGWFGRGGNSVRWSGGPAVAGDLVVVGGLDGQLQTLSSIDGSVRWEAQLGAEIICAPAIGDGVVVVRTQDGRLQAFDSANGNRRWVYEESVPTLSQRGNSSPLIGNGVVFVGFDNGRVVAVNLADGSPVWATPLSLGEGRTEVERISDADGRMLLDGNNLFVASYRGQIASLYADSGRVAWQRDLSSYSGVDVNATAVVVSDADGTVWAFDRQSGANLWKQDELAHRWLSAPAIVGNSVVVGDLDGYLHWLSLDTGALVARDRLGRKAIEGAPISVDGVVYVEDVAGKLAAYRASP
ncbi:MAG: outer membrane protein assembly factor BamB [Dokdonella sp.]